VLPVVGGVGFLCILFSKFRKAGRWFENGADLMMIGFILAIGLSHVSHFWFGGAWISMEKFFPIFVGYFLVAHSPDSKGKLEGLITVVIICTVILAVVGIVQYHTGTAIGGATLLIERVQDGYGKVVAEYKRIRWIGPFNDPNDLALAFVLVIPFLLHRLSEKKYLFPFLFLPPVVYALYLTNSRGAALALAISFLMFFVIRKGKWKGALLAFIAIGLLVLFGPSRVGDISTVDESAHGRLDAWYEGYQILKENPVFGAGADTFTDFNRITAHNSLVLVFAELGLFGAFFFIGMFYFPLERVLRYFSRNKGKPIESYPSMGIYSAMIASLAGVITSIFFLSRSYTLLPYLIVGMLMSCSMAGSNSRSFEKPDKRVSLYRHICNIGIAEIGMILMINLLVKVFL
jgi:putative inorganic carbon (hco3(-)) transporter